MSKPLLSLSTLDPKRPTIEIDGQKYECAVAEDFGIVQHARLERLIREIRNVQGMSEDETEEQAEERAIAAEGACRKAITIIMPDLPSELLAKLKLSHLLAILSAYTDFIQAAGTANQVKPLPNRTGAKSSRASKGSTEVVPPAAG